MINKRLVKKCFIQLHDFLFAVKKALVVISPLHMVSRLNIKLVDKVDYTPVPSWGGWELNDKRSNLKEHEWRARTEAMMDLVDKKKVKSIMDMGAGGQHLRNYVPQGIEYIPVDIVQREGLGKTIVVDFNKGEFPERNADCMFCAGILEYIEKSEDWIQKVCSHSDREVIIAYHCAKKGCDIRQRYLEGWTNHISRKKLIDLFRENGFALSYSKYMCHQFGTIFKFEKYFGE